MNNLNLSINNGSTISVNTGSTNTTASFSFFQPVIITDFNGSNPWVTQNLSFAHKCKCGYMSEDYYGHPEGGWGSNSIYWCDGELNAVTIYNA